MLEPHGSLRHRSDPVGRGSDAFRCCVLVLRADGDADAGCGVAEVDYVMVNNG